MIPSQAFKQRIEDDPEDLAMSWVENELGRYRFKENWAYLKSTGKARERIARWLDVTNVSGNPDELIQILDKYAEGYSGKWR